mmetsp:Transcript_13155/g.37559  ORF Transcript_13155/g.37559 Transcript_13155/m.37559 type:complete len:85 (+) Transcript_13155:963-1217(+)
MQRLGALRMIGFFIAEHAFHRPAPDTTWDMAEQWFEASAPDFSVRLIRLMQLWLEFLQTTSLQLPLYTAFSTGLPVLLLAGLQL